MRFKNGLKPRACKTCEASTKASRLPRLGGRIIPQMNKPAAQSNQRANVFFCVSLNPAIDTRLTVKGFIPGRVNHAAEVCRTPGGKAAHVNREILDTSGEVTEVLEPGGTITQSEWSDFLQVCVGAFQRAAHKKIAVISGSLPPGVPTEACATLIGLARSADCLAFVDSSGLPLSKALAAGPDLVKVNREEAEFVTQVAIRDPISAAQAARKLLDMGANSAAVSLGDRGIVGIRKHEQLAIHAWTTPVQGKSTVGCGDSALAGLAFATATDGSLERSLALAVACGASNCLAALPGRIVREDVSRFEEGVQMERLQV